MFPVRPQGPPPRPMHPFPSRPPRDPFQLGGRPPRQSQMQQPNMQGNMPGRTQGNLPGKMQGNMQNLMAMFQTEDGNMDFDKIMGTANQINGIYKQVSPMLSKLINR